MPDKELSIKPEKKSKELIAQLENIREHHKNVSKGVGALRLLCDPFNLPEMHRLIISKIHLDPRPDGPDIYKPTGSSGYALHFAALERLAIEAGIKLEDEKCKRTMVNEDYYEYEAVGYYTGIFGDRHAAKGIGFITLSHLKDDLFYKYTEQEKRFNRDKTGQPKSNSEDWISTRTENAFRPKRNKRAQLAASEAYSQVYRKLLKFGGVYPVEMFQGPIMIVRCKIAPDLNDPESLRLLRLAGVNATDGIFGPQAALPEPIRSGAINYHADEASTTIGEPDEDPDMGGTPSFTQEADELPSEDPPTKEEVFDGYDDATKKTTLSQLINKKAFTFSTGKSLDTMDPKDYLRLYTHLLTLEDFDDVPY